MTAVTAPNYTQLVLRGICDHEQDLLAHLYWPARQTFFEQSQHAHAHGKPWRLKATPWHGVHGPSRSTLNFLVANIAWVETYAIAAERRGIHHGLLVRRATLEALANRPGYELVDVRVGHPQKYGVHDPSDFWRYDLGNHRFSALDAMRFCTVVRLATPAEEDSRYIDIPAASVVTWW